jgi:hypothetical protein
MSCSFQRLVFTTAAKMFSSTYKVMVGGEGDAVGYLNPLLAIAATINVSLPGQQPDLRSVHEDSRLLDSRLADKSGKEGWQGCRGLLCLGILWLTEGALYGVAWGAGETQGATGWAWTSWCVLRGSSIAALLSPVAR